MIMFLKNIMKTEKVTALFRNGRETTGFMEYIYLLYFAMTLYLFVVVSEYDHVRIIVFRLNVALSIVCLVNLFFFIGRFIWGNRSLSEIKSLISIKAVLSLMTIFIEQIRNGISKMILGEQGLKNISQIAVINIWFILACCLLFGFLLIKHAKLSGFWKKHWVSLVLCLYILVGFTFSLTYYTCDYNSVETYTASFSYSDTLKKDIQQRNVLSDNKFVALNDFQKNDIRSLIKNGKDNIEYMDVEIKGQNLLLTNEKIGRDWAGYYYEDLTKKYNSYAIEDITPIKLGRENLIRSSVSYGRDYYSFFDKDYILAKIVLFNAPSEEFNEAILLRNFDAGLVNQSDQVKEQYLVFERANFENQTITVSELEVNIFLNCLSESSTLLDSTISDIKVVQDGSSNSLFDYIYYSAVVITTLGFGDITPISMLVRVLTIIEAFSGIIIMGLFLAKAFEGKKVNL